MGGVSSFNQYRPRPVPRPLVVGGFDLIVSRPFPRPFFPRLFPRPFYSFVVWDFGGKVMTRLCRVKNSYSKSRLDFAM
jgi:hypothetical protein